MTAVCRVCALSFAMIPALAWSAEVLFTDGPQQYQGTPYYWLAEWKLVVTLPGDVATGDRFEVLFGSKGPAKRTLYFQYDGKTGVLADVRCEPFQWIALPVGPLSPGKTVVLSGKGRRQVAFLAGVRIVGRSRETPKVKAVRIAGPVRSGDGVAVWSDLPGFAVNDETRRLWAVSPEKPVWRRAERSARYAGIALSKVQRWLHERVLPVHDQKTGLFRPTGPVWNYRDTAADCYPFYVWAAWFTDRSLLDTVMLRTLMAEQRLGNHVDRLPVPYDMDTGRKQVIPFDRMIFGASEYAKDGLVPIVELTGPASPWFA
ncbi:MAG TPA: hypothetical protein EYP14_07320, partial [Planctomycetaceae bacterium]|nr:hypothetical protein [Planctomycetaceae bacterium]